MKLTRSSADDRTRLLRGVTFALVALGASATEIAAAEPRPVVASLARAALWLAASLGVAFFVGRRLQRNVPPYYALTVLALLGLAPFFIEPIQRSWFSTGNPLELRMIFGLRNLAFGLAAFAVWPVCLRLAAMVSMFLILFAVSLATHPAVYWLLGLYSGLGSVWLMLAYWGRLSATRAHHGIEVIHLPVRRYRLLAVAAGVVLAVMGTAVAAGVVGPQRTAHVLAEWLPTSGGTGDFDPFARDGVNDGDDVVSGDNALSTGMVDSDTFLTSDAPSIYDMYSDLYGEPTRQRDRERAVALDGQSKLNNERNSPAHNGRASRDFATMRTGSRKLRQPSDRAARALFEIQGRTPLHIRATAFDSFDGERWSEAPVNLKLCFLEQIRGSCWMGTSDRECSPRAGNSERHQFKIASPLGDSLVPTPAHLTRFRIARVDQASFYSWNHDQILRLAERTMPAGVSVETECSAVDPSAIDKNQFFPGPRDDRDRYLAVPAELPPSLQSLAHQWTQGVPSGWEQISAVVQHLRSDYTVDAAACPPADCAEPLQWFLFESRRGPDYQFAGAAAVLLRVLGYHTRLVSGFYAAPEHYDPETASTPVVREDVHFWPEVMVNSGDWLVVEPTPGYEVLRPSEPWWRRAIAVFVGLGGWLWMHKFEMLFSMAGAGLLWWKRRELLDTFDLARLRLFPSKSWQESVRRAVGLLERRGRWAGRPRRVCETPSAWLNASEATRREPVLQTLSAMAEWFAYAPELPAPWQAAEVHEVCRRSLEVWTLKRARAESRCIPA